MGSNNEVGSFLWLKYVNSFQHSSSIQGVNLTIQSKYMAHGRNSVELFLLFNSCYKVLLQVSGYAIAIKSVKSWCILASCIE